MNDLFGGTLPEDNSHLGRARNIRAQGYGQSYEKKMAYAQAYAAVIQKAGITAYAQGRLD